jgi:hypothetical protein
MVQALCDSKDVLTFIDSRGLLKDEDYFTTIKYLSQFYFQGGVGYPCENLQFGVRSTLFTLFHPEKIIRVKDLHLKFTAKEAEEFGKRFLKAVHL